MSCAICFFRDKNQRALKENCFGIPRYEDKLERYKRYYMEGITNLVSLSKCACSSVYTDVNMVGWTDAFIDNLKTNKTEIETTFDQISSCYFDFITKNQKIALDNLWNFLTTNNLIISSVHPIDYMKLLFRGRMRGTFSESDINEFFHIPFTKRHLIGNQRFSISGQPMVYFGSSILTVKKELDLDISNLAAAAFLPSYSHYYYQKIFDLKNYINDVIENALPGIYSAGCSLTYFDDNLSPNHLSIKTDIKRSILMQICTFPSEYKGSFIAEYVLPQMLTTALMENDYAGIIFPTTKDLSDLSDFHRFSSHHINLGLFVSYNTASDIDQKLLDTFMAYTLDGSESFDFTVEAVVGEVEGILSGKRNPAVNYNDYILTLVKLKLHFEYLTDSSVSGVKYFDTTEGKLELELYMKMLRHLKTIIV